MSAKSFDDLSTRTKVYVGTIISAGAITVVHSVHALFANNTSWNWTLLAILTLVSGSATVKLPALPATISVSETFVFTSVLLFGIPAGTITVALDALVISIWSYKRNDPFYKIIFNLFALPLTIWIAAQVFFSLPTWPPFLGHIAPLSTSTDPVPIISLLVPLAVLAFVYFGLNSWIIAFAIALEREMSALAIWRNNFAVLSLNYIGGASVAALLVTYTRKIQWEYLALIVPLLIALYFTFSHSMGRVADANKHLSQLNALYMSTIETLAMAIDAKDQITHGHIRRVQIYAVGLARQMGVTEQELIRAIEAAALLHDMGKLAVPEYILNKPGPLTPAEFERMKLHASVGADILSAIQFPYPVVPIVRHHHENWDGTGYPDGLSGTGIPIGARILSVVDCFDALTSDRPYRPRLSDDDAIAILLSRRGTMYDPLVVDKFIEVHTEIAPEPLPAPEPRSLQAITNASVPSASNAQPTAPLEEIAASTDEMLTLFHLARGLNNRMTVSDVGDIIAKHLRRLVPCSIAVFLLYRRDENDLIAAHAVGEGHGLLVGLTIGVGERLSGWVAANRRAIRNSDPILDLGDLARAMSPRLRSCLSVPLLTGPDLMGVLSLYSPVSNAFREEHQRIVEVVAPQLAAILKQAVDFEHQHVSALRDRLTGLPNYEHLKQLAAPGATNYGPGEPNSAIAVEVIRPLYLSDDNDPRWNDVLDLVVRAVRRTLRAADLLFRYQTNGFIVLLLHTKADTARQILQRLEESLREERRRAGAEAFAYRLGVGSSPDDGGSIEELVTVAIQKMMSDSARDSFSSRRSDSIH